MIANYGYRDAEGEFYVTIDTDRCSSCAEKPCISACPGSVLTGEEDPYGEMVVAVDALQRNRLKHACADCKPHRNRPSLPCTAACPCGAITHSW